MTVTERSRGLARNRPEILTQLRVEFGGNFELQGYPAFMAQWSAAFPVEPAPFDKGHLFGYINPAQAKKL